MQTISELLDLAKKRNAISSDRKLGRALGIEGVHRYRQGIVYPSDKTCAALSELTGVPAKAIIASVHMQTAPTENIREIYKQWMDQAMAAGLAFVFALGMLSAPAPAAASTGQQAASTPGEYILCKMI